MADNLLSYKDFCGSIEYSAADGCFFGKIVGSADLVTFEGENKESLKAAFCEAVEDYLALCEAEGKEPRKKREEPFSILASSEPRGEASWSNVAAAL